MNNKLHITTICLTLIGFFLVSACSTGKKHKVKTEVKISQTNARLLVSEQPEQLQIPFSGCKAHQ